MKKLSVLIVVGVLSLIGGTTNSIAKIILMADIGGTKARLCVIDTAHTGIEQASSAIKNVTVFECKNFTSLEALLSQFMLRTHTKRIDKALVAVAALVADGKAQMTNISQWPAFSEATLSKALDAPVVLFNDVQAQAFSLADPEGNAQYLKPLFPASRPQPQNDGLKNGAFVMGGTGLGVALLVPPAVPGHTPRVFPTESGHMSIGGNKDDYPLLAMIQRMSDQKNAPITAEQVASGRGLPLIFMALWKLKTGKVYPREVRAVHIVNWSQGIASKEKEVAQQAIQAYFRFLGFACRNIALMTLSSHLVLGGGAFDQIMLKSSPEVHALLLQTFQESDQPAMRSFLKTVAFYRLDHPYPGILGLSTYARAKNPA